MKNINKRHASLTFEGYNLEVPREAFKILGEECKTCHRFQIPLGVSLMPWRRGIVVIAHAYRTEDPEFESRQGVRFFFRNLYTLQCCCHKLNLHCHCEYFRKEMLKKEYP
jgi:hypothetical protein